MLYLRISPVYWGYGIPRGDGSAVVVVPGFLGMDFYLSELFRWLGGIGYKPFSSRIGFNAECPNLLVQQCLVQSVEHAYRKTGRKVHLIGHSLGGLMARAVATQIPKRVASLITLGAPLRGFAVHGAVERLADYIRQQILERNGDAVLPTCYTPRCTCEFAQTLAINVPKKIRQTAIYTRDDGVIDWRQCRTGDPEIDVEVAATHMGLVFSPLVYQAIAERLFQARAPNGRAHREELNRRAA